MEKTLRPGQTDCKIYYRKGYFTPWGEDLAKAKAGFEEDRYEMVCHYPVFKAPGHRDIHILSALFELFNWEHSGFQPTDEEIGFKKSEEVYHTSLSIGDVIEIEGHKYICDGNSWTLLRA